MVQRRTPGGQGPARRPRPAARRNANSRDAAVRPAAGRRPAATGGVKRTSAPRPRRLTGRAAVLLLVLVGLLLAYTYPIRVYLSQQAEIARLEREHAVKLAHIDGLKAERAKWDDPEYVKAQARKRFQLVERGDRTYIVTFEPAGAARAAGADPGATRAADPPWYGKLWSSLGEANR